MTANAAIARINSIPGDLLPRESFYAKTVEAFGALPAEAAVLECDVVAVIAGIEASGTYCPFALSNCHVPDDDRHFRAGRSVMMNLETVAFLR